MKIDFLLLFFLVEETLFLFLVILCFEKEKLGIISRFEINENKIHENLLDFVELEDDKMATVEGWKPGGWLWSREQSAGWNKSETIVQWKSATHIFTYESTDGNWQRAYCERAPTIASSAHNLRISITCNEKEENTF